MRNQKVDGEAVLEVVLDEEVILEAVPEVDQEAVIEVEDREAAQNLVDDREAGIEVGLEQKVEVDLDPNHAPRHYHSAGADLCHVTFPIHPVTS